MLIETESSLLKLQHLPAQFTPAQPILEKIEAAGFEAYFVGGCVRDTILGQPIHDIDIATSAYPAEVKAIFHRTVDTGIEHGTVMILDHGTGYETTTFRTESGYQDFRRPDQVTFVRELKDDLKRRDFTINALALKADGTVIDLFDGLGDLKRGIIRAVGDPAARFHEDALRMMRAVRFAAKLNFQIDPTTLAGIQENAPLLAKIAVERTQVEFEKLLLGLNPPAGLTDLISTQLYRYCPGLATQRGGLTNLAAQTTWNLTSPVAAWTALVVALQLTSQEVTPFLRAWKLANHLITAVKRAQPLVAGILADQVTPQLLFASGAAALQPAQEVAWLFGSTLTAPALTAAYQQLPIKSARELALDGGQLMQALDLKPGPVVGQLMTTLTQAVVAGRVANEPARLLAAAQAELKGARV